MKKVMFSIGSLAGGGAERVVSVWSGQLCRAGYDVSILLYGRAEREYAVDSRIRICCVTERYADFKEIPFPERIKRIRAILKSEKPDTVISFLSRNQIMVMLACPGLKIRRIDTVRISPWEVHPGAVERFLWKQSFRTSKKIIVQTEEQKEFFDRHTQKKCVVIANPLDASYIAEPTGKRGGRPRRFIAAGRINRQKNYAMMVEAFMEAHRACPDLTLSIYGTAGDRAYLAELQERIDKGGAASYIRLEGHCGDMKKAFCACDAFLMTSDYEGMPNALAEAMACGLICLSTSCRTGPKDMIQDGVTGYLVEPGNVSAAAETIEKIALMDEEAATEMGARARESILAQCGKDNSLRILESIV